MGKYAETGMLGIPIGTKSELEVETHPGRGMGEFEALRTVGDGLDYDEALFERAARYGQREAQIGGSPSCMQVLWVERGAQVEMALGSHGGW